jgi:glyoxylase-like metal-dependent hydrolase (beta-lactamase superfamily II)
MKIKQRPMGPYQTNCYILSFEKEETDNNQVIDIIIDPGVDATLWVKENVTNPVAILNTHGHFDHVWSNQELKEHFNIPLYTPKGDIMLVQNSNWMPDMPPSYPDIEVVSQDDNIARFTFNGIEVIFRHFPGHCPGCSTIEVQNAMFSGDFIFKQSIGRTDFPFSDPKEMKESLTKFLDIEYDKIVYPGHGETTTIKHEQDNVPYWLNSL